MHHYTYVVFNDITGDYYIGARSSDTPPDVDPYMGSFSDTALHAEMKRGYPWEKYIISTYNTRVEAFEDETHITRPHLKNGACLNKRAGWTLTEDSEKLRVANLRKTLATPEWRERNAASRRDKRRSETTRAAISAGKLGKPQPNVSAALKGRKHTDAQRKANSDSRRGQPSPMKGKTFSAEARKNMGRKKKST